MPHPKRELRKGIAAASFQIRFLTPNLAARFLFTDRLLPSCRYPKAAMMRFETLCSSCFTDAHGYFDAGLGRSAGGFHLLNFNGGLGAERLLGSALTACIDRGAFCEQPFANASAVGSVLGILRW